MQHIATRDGQAPGLALPLDVRIQQAERDAAYGCGQSDVLYETRVQAAYAGILAAAPEADRAATEAALKLRGFERDFKPYVAGEGECDLTGIEVDCCPCGRHA